MFIVNFLEVEMELFHEQRNFFIGHELGYLWPQEASRNMVVIGIVGVKLVMRITKFLNR